MADNEKKNDNDEDMDAVRQDMEDAQAASEVPKAKKPKPQEPQKKKVSFIAFVVRSFIIAALIFLSYVAYEYFITTGEDLSVTGLSLSLKDVFAPKTEDKARDMGAQTYYDPVASDSYIWKDLKDQTGERDAYKLTIPDSRVTEEFQGVYIPSRNAARDLTPFSVYATPHIFNSRNKSLGVILTNLGLSRPLTLMAIKKTPPEVSLAFSPFAEDLKTWMRMARHNGHEVLLEIPLENKAGESTYAKEWVLSRTNAREDMQQKLYELMSLGIGYVGLMTLGGSSFSTSAETLSTFLEEVRDRGLMVVDGMGAGSFSLIPQISGDMQIPYAWVDVRMDQEGPSLFSLNKSIEYVIYMLEFNPAAVATMDVSVASIYFINKTLPPLLKSENTFLIPISTFGSLVKESWQSRHSFHQ